MAGRSTLFEWVDEAFDGQLAARLHEWRTEDEMTIDQIARRLADHDREVSRETVRRWLVEKAAA